MKKLNKGLEWTKYNCPQCGEKFKTLSDYNHHFKIVNLHSKKFKCLQCGEKFKAKSDLYSHLKRVHVKIGFKPIKCLQCKKIINSIKELELHYENIEHEDYVKKQIFYNKVRKEQNQRYLKCDLHSLELKEAKSEILSCLEECSIRDKKEIEIIHGYKHGHVLKDYIESNRFINEMAENGYKLEVLKKYFKLGSKRFSILDFI